jgi:hypothetical protein
VITSSSDIVHQFFKSLGDGRVARHSDMGTVASKVYPYNRQIVPYQWINFDDLELRSKQAKRHLCAFRLI